MGLRHTEETTPGRSRRSSEYVPIPQIDASIRIKGNVPESVVAAFEQLASDNFLDISITITATWPDDEPGQLRLFGPPEVVREQAKMLQAVHHAEVRVEEAEGQNQDGESHG